MTIRTAHATWNGTLKQGAGRVKLGSGVFEGAYSFPSRFENGPGTNPEELLGAAHAGCFTMALSKILGEAGLTAEKLETTAEVTLAQVEGAFTITTVHLTLKGKVPGADQAKFQELAAKAKAGCPVSKVLRAEISLDASLAD